MKKITVISGLALALVLPTGAVGAPQPDNGDKRAAKAECKTLRGGTDATREGFLTLYRSFGACVSAKAREEAREEKTARANAAWECKDERSDDADGFKMKYGTNANNRNAFGKCVSQKAKQNEAAADRRDRREATALKNAAEECAAERDADAQAFEGTYGEGENAFGECVSGKAGENDTA